jgi:D-hydroxyproline dehydrogenase subunit gamma
MPFERTDTGGRTVRLTFDGAPIEAREGESLAAALIAAGHTALRTTTVSGAPRGPFCMMGVCFECLVEIDGVGNQQACMLTVREGMAVRRQSGARDLAMREASA